MKDKLEVNMYVRTDLGEIGKITSVASDDVIGTGEMTFYNSEPYLKGNETKASFNIIDLIEVGDYVNGLRVEESKYGELYTSYTYMGGDIGLQKETYTTFLKDYEEDYIYSIVTKEIFSSMEYRLGDE